MAKGKNKRRASGAQFKPGNRMSPRCRISQTYQQSSCDDPEPSTSSSSATDIKPAPLIKDMRQWWYKSPYLLTHGIDRLKMTENDRALLKNILEVRLSEQAVLSVSNNTSTQKNEALNRGVQSNLPKHIKNSRNFHGKLASKTLQLNNNLRMFVLKQTERLTGRLLSPRASKGLKSLSRQAESHKIYQRSGKYKKQRIHNRAKLENMYHQARNAATYTDDYVKGQLDTMGLPNLKG